MKKGALFFVFILLLIISSVICSAGLFPLWFNWGISGKAIQQIQTNQSFNLTISYQGYESYPDYEWVLIKSEKLNGKGDFYWRINDFAEAVKIKSVLPLLISKSYAILATKQVAMGSCAKCNEIRADFGKREFVLVISTMMQGRTDLEVYIGKTKITKERIIKNSTIIQERITTNSLNLGALSNYIQEESIKNLHDISYSISVDNSKLNSYFNDTNTAITKNISSGIIIKIISDNLS